MTEAKNENAEYSLEETICNIDEWMQSSDPMPPDDLIELFNSASVWLKELVAVRSAIVAIPE